MQRTFTVENLGNKMSLSSYVSKTPVSAAMKGFNESIGSSKTAKKRITVADTKSGKTYTYDIVRVSDPKVINIAGKDITFKYSTKAKSVNKIKKCIKKCKA